MATMKAWIRQAYGGPEVLQLAEVARPVPKPNEVLVRVKASTVAAGDGHLLTGLPYLLRLGFGLFKPSNPIAGSDFAGVVEAVGDKVTANLKVGDEVFGEGVQSGTLADYTVVKETALFLKPKGISFEEAAALPVGGCTALQGLRDTGKVKEGDKVLVIGASGGVGCLAVQIAKSYKATVTAVCSSANVDWVRALGADQVIAYDKEDFKAGETKYDVVFDAQGYSFSDCKQVLAPVSIYCSVGAPVGDWIGPVPHILSGLARSVMSSQKFGPVASWANEKDLSVLKQLVEDGKLKAVIDRKFKFDEVPEAYKAQAAGHAKGRLVVEVA